MAVWLYATTYMYASMRVCECLHEHVHAQSWWVAIYPTALTL